MFLGVSNNTLTYLPQVWYFENKGSATSPVFNGSSFQSIKNGPLANLTFINSPSPFFYDIDNDGYDDLIVGEDKSVQVFWNNISVNENGTIISQNFVNFTGTSYDPFRNIIYQGLPIEAGGDVNIKPIMVDISGDGLDDFIYGAFLGGVIFHKNKGSLTFDDEGVELFSIGQRSSPLAHDLDNDGDIDFLVGGIDGGISYFTSTSEYHFVYERNLGEANPLNQENVQGLASLASVDLNNDGYEEIVAGDYAGNIQIYFNEASSSNSFTLRPVDQGIGDIDVGSSSYPQFANISGTKYADIMVGGLNLLGENGVYVYINPGVSDFYEMPQNENPLWNLTKEFIVQKPVPIDINDDGIEEIALAHGAPIGKVALLMKNETGEWEIFTNHPKNPFRNISEIQMAITFIDLGF